MTEDKADESVSARFRWVARSWSYSQIGSNGINKWKTMINSASEGMESFTGAGVVSPVKSCYWSPRVGQCHSHCHSGADLTGHWQKGRLSMH